VRLTSAFYAPLRLPSYHSAIRQAIQLDDSKVKGIQAESRENQSRGLDEVEVDKLDNIEGHFTKLKLTRFPGHKLDPNRSRIHQSNALNPKQIETG
jgi:hypothetical protein